MKMLPINPFRLSSGGSGGEFFQLRFSPQAGYNLSSEDTFAHKNATNQASIIAGTPQSSGRYYAEIQVGASGGMLVGVAASVSSAHIGNYADSVGIDEWSAYINLTGAVSRRSAPDGTYNGAYLLCIACDFDSKKLWIGHSGVYRDSGDPATGANPNVDSWTTSVALAPAARTYFGSASNGLTLPSGYSHLPEGFSPWPQL